MCSIELDTDTGETITLNEASLSIEESNVTIVIKQLRQNRLYNVAVNATNPTGSATSQTEISK